MKKRHIVGLSIAIAFIVGLAYAEQMTFSTYYPAPYGRYREFSTTGKTTLATDEFGMEGANARVGIGTTNPQAKLEISGKGSTGHPAILLTHTDGGADDYVIINDNGTFRIQEQGGGTRLHIDGAGNIYANYDQLYIEAATGSVGIGTTSPSRPLEVNGVAKVDAAVLNKVDLSTNPIPNPVDGMIACDVDNTIKQYDESIPDWKPLGGGGGTSQTLQSAASNPVNMRSSGFQDIPNMSITINTNGGNVLVLFNGVLQSNEDMRVRLLFDGVQRVYRGYHSNIAYGWDVSMHWLETGLSSGNHTAKIQWASNTSNTTDVRAKFGNERVLTVIEF